LNTYIKQANTLLNQFTSSDNLLETARSAGRASADYSAMPSFRDLLLDYVGRKVTPKNNSPELTMTDKSLSDAKKCSTTVLSSYNRTLSYKRYENILSPTERNSKSKPPPFKENYYVQEIPLHSINNEVNSIEKTEPTKDDTIEKQIIYEVLSNKKPNSGKRENLLSTGKASHSQVPLSRNISATKTKTNEKTNHLKLNATSSSRHSSQGRLTTNHSSSSDNTIKNNDPNKILNSLLYIPKKHTSQESALYTFAAPDKEQKGGSCINIESYQFPRNIIDTAQKLQMNMTQKNGSALMSFRGVYPTSEDPTEASTRKGTEVQSNLSNQSSRRSLNLVQLLKKEREQNSKSTLAQN